MKKLLPNLVFLFLIFSCGQDEREYKLVVIVEEAGYSPGETQRVEKDTVTFKAQNDSIAYFEAYEKLIIGQKASKMMLKSYGANVGTPIGFMLLNEEGYDVALSTFNNMEEEKFKIKEEISNLSSFSEDKEDVALVVGTTVDSSKIKELTRYFNIRQDEFDPSGVMRYTPKSAPKYINRNGIYGYFGTTENGIPVGFRLRLQYHADDWLFFKKVQFVIDEVAFEYYPSNTETDSGNGGEIWEWSDEIISSIDIELIRALANAKSAKMKLIGSQYHKIKTISSNEILNLKRSLEFYEALGGKL